MKKSQKILCILILSLLTYTGATKAQSTLTTDSLADLIANHGTLSIDDKVFSGFGFSANGLTSFNSSLITVTASEDANGIDYLTWGGNISFVSGGVATADLKLNYIVTANPGQVSMIDQSYTGSAQNGFLSVDETVATGSFGGTVVGFSHLQVGDMSDPPAETVQGDNLIINPSQSVLYVTKDIGLAVSSTSGGFITISQVSQSFHQIPVPEPSSLGLLFGGFGVMAWMQGRRRK